jgi:hypothetical protein
MELGLWVWLWDTYGTEPGTLWDSIGNWELELWNWDYGFGYGTHMGLSNFWSDDHFGNC